MRPLPARTGLLSTDPHPVRRRPHCARSVVEAKGRNATGTLPPLATLPASVPLRSATTYLRCARSVESEDLARIGNGAGRRDIVPIQRSIPPWRSFADRIGAIPRSHELSKVDALLHYLTSDEYDRIFAAAALVGGFVKERELETLLATTSSDASLADRMVATGALADSERTSFESALEKRWRECGQLKPAIVEYCASIIVQALAEAKRPIVRALLSTTGAEPGKQPVKASIASYRLIEVYGEGGLGQVWRARDLDLDRDVAIKHLRTDVFNRREAHERFAREARITGQLQHPNIISVFQYGHDAEGADFYVMPLVEGQTLDDVIAALHEDAPDGKPDQVEMNRLLNRFISICTAVAFAHSKGIVHRDLKPTNVMLGRFGEIYLLDWGLAGAQSAEAIEDPDADGSDPALTRAGMIIGSPLYMAPEQASGDVARIGPASDIFGLGGILFKILTGRDPRQAVKGESLRRFFERIETAPAPSVCAAAPRAPRAMDAICAKAMAPDPDKRYRDVTGLTEDVERWLAGEPISTYREPWPRRMARSAVSRPVRSVTVIGVLIALITSASVLLTALWVNNSIVIRQATDGMRDEGRDAAQALHENVANIEKDVRFLSGIPGLRALLRDMKQTPSTEAATGILKDFVAGWHEYVHAFLAPPRGDKVVAIFRDAAGKGEIEFGESVDNPAPWRSFVQETISGSTGEALVSKVMRIKLDDKSRPTAAIYAAAPIRDGNQALGVIGLRVEPRARFGEVFNKRLAYEAIAVTDEEANILFWSGAASTDSVATGRRLTDYPSARDLIRRSDGPAAELLVQTDKEIIYARRLSYGQASKRNYLGMVIFVDRDLLLADPLEMRRWLIVVTIGSVTLLSFIGLVLGRIVVQIARRA